MPSIQPLRPLPLLLLVACIPADPETSHDTDPTATSTTTPVDPALDSTAAPFDPACIDDYHGNQDAQTALELQLDTTTTTRIVLGDGTATTPSERGRDQLVVCDGATSDVFVLHTECPGYLGIELRRLEGDVPDLYLYDAPPDSLGPPSEHTEGSWYGFFLEPIHRKVDPGPHVIEVRHSGGAPERYELAVSVLPRSPCPPP